jgi:hypothetical protein
MKEPVCVCAHKEIDHYFAKYHCLKCGAVLDKHVCAKYQPAPEPKQEIKLLMPTDEWLDPTLGLDAFRKYWQLEANLRLDEIRAKDKARVAELEARLSIAHDANTAWELVVDRWESKVKELEAMMLTDFEIAGVFSEMLLADGTYCDCKTCVSTIAKLKAQREQHG